MNTDYEDDDEDWCQPSTSRDTSNECIIHCSRDNGKLIKVTTLDKWNTLISAAKINQHAVLMDLDATKEVTIPENVYYHKNCRSAFILQANRTEKLRKIEHVVGVDSGEGSPDTIVRKSKRKSDSNEILMPKTCIFCTYLSKKKKDNTKEFTIKCTDYDAPLTIKTAQKQKQSEGIAHVLANYDLIANEAHYHTSCYKIFTKLKKEKDMNLDEEENKREKLTDEALEQLYGYIRTEIIETKKIELMTIVMENYCSFLGEKGLDTNISKSEKRKVRELLKNKFETTVTIFAIDNSKLLLIPKTVSMFDVVIDNYHLKNELKRIKKLQRQEDQVVTAAKILRTEIIENKPNLSWPPQPSELNGENILLPPLTQLFYRNVINGRDCECEHSDLKINSFYQDLSFAVTRTPSAKNILLPFAIKSLTGNVELIRIINRLAHGVSLTYLMEIDTGIAIQKISPEPDKVVLPDELQKAVPTTLVYDNIDRLEETLSGSGTSHRVNGIGVQEGLVGPLFQRPVQDIPKSKRRSLEFTTHILPSYISGQRPQPPELQNIRFESEEEKTERLIARRKDLLWITSRIQKSIEKVVPSWTGFNIVVRKDKMQVKDRVGYLPSINSPATSMSTIHEMLVQAIKVKNELELSGIVLVCDQAIYAKAVEIAWKHCDEFKPIVLRLGAFHTACTFMAAIGKRFKDAGFRDITIESSIVAEGSLNKVIEGKQYNRCIRTHKLLYEAFMRLIWKGFLNWISEECVSDNEEVNAQIEDLCEEFSPEVFRNILKDKSFSIVYELFQDYRKTLYNENGNMCAFWMSYIDMVEVLLDLIRASREGNWTLHLASIRAMIPWFFAYDHTNYARYLPWYLMNMQSLESSHPEISQYLNNGGFSVQLSSNNPFGKIAMDQTIEETVNKDTQTPGGTKGFSLKSCAVARYYITADHKKECLRLLRAMVNSENGSIHPDLQKTRIGRDENDVKKVLQMFEATWQNPFEDQELRNVSTGVIATPDVVNDLLNAYQKGKEVYDQFIVSRLNANRNLAFFDTLRKLQLKTFGSMNKKTVNVKGSEVVLTVDRNLFGKMALVAQSRNLNMKEVLRYELGPFPWSIATCDGSLRKTNKATLSNNLEKTTLQAETISANSSTIIDAMALVQRIAGTVNGKTFSDISKFVFRHTLIEGAMSNRIDVVFDTYKDLSIKDIERSRRGNDATLTFNNILPGHKIKQFDKFLKSSANKMALIRFLGEEWKKEEYRSLLLNKSFFISCDKKCWRLTVDEVSDVPELLSDQEEADTKIFLHAKHASNEGCEELLIVSEDTDVHVLGISFSTEIAATIFQKRGTKNRSRIINLSFLNDVLSPNVALSLPGLHAFTGCDSVSAFSGKGKLAALKLVKGSEEYQETFKQLGESLNLTEEVETTLEKFVCQMYGGGKTADVSDLRYLIFCAKSGDVGSNQLPPSKRSLRAHILRTNYQTYIWKHSLIAEQNIADPIGNGWKIDGGRLVIDWGYERAAPDEILEFMACKCKKKCIVESCCCASNRLPCTDMCKCKNCDNKNIDLVEEEEESYDFDEMDDYYDDLTN